MQNMHCAIVGAKMEQPDGELNGKAVQCLALTNYDHPK
jgi:hypothetical protein